MTVTDTEKPRFAAAVKLIGRCGAVQFRIEHTDPADGPLVWTAIGVWGPGVMRAAADPSPLRAVLNLCELVIDGGVCAHCGKQSAFEPTVGGALAFREASEDIAGAELTARVCIVTWDETTGEYRPTCRMERHG